jgi:DNA-damage-inducible protein D
MAMPEEEKSALSGEELGAIQISPFDAIRHQSEQYGEYWSGRELYKLLGYSRWEKFRETIERARMACKEAGQAASDHFHLEVKMIKAGKGARREIDDIFLSRYACYLVLQNADPAGKPIVALAQTYFAVQTRRQELADQEALVALSEDQLRLVRRSQMSTYNTQLANAARNVGIIQPKDFAIFQDHGYKGLYGGMGAKDIHQRKKLKKSEGILDYMGSDELAANIFRASQAKQKIEREEVGGKEEANNIHYRVGKKVRQTIEELGGTMPEDLPVPGKSIQQIQREKQQYLKQRLQLPLFPLEDE